MVEIVLGNGEKEVSTFWSLEQYGHKKKRKNKVITRIRDKIGDTERKIDIKATEERK